MRFQPVNTARAEPWTSRYTKITAVAIAVLLPLVETGCSRAAKPIVGGTSGSLHSGGQPLGQMQVNVFRKGAARFTLIGVGYVASDGSFELVTADSSGPLTLEPGTYHCTIESLGAEVEIPPSYTDPAATPLVQFAAPGETLQLRLPLLRGMN